jgi:phage tail sheath gpL-like
MPVSFANIPSNWRMPLYWVEVDPSKAGLPVARQPALLVGQKLTAGTAPVNVAVPIGTQAQADQKFGQGSHLANMFKAFFRNNFAHEVWGLPLADPAGTAPAVQPATGTITVTTTPPIEGGTIHLYIAGEHIGITVGATDTAATIATAIAAEINDEEDLPVIAAAATGVVTVTARHKGVIGNEIDMRDSYYGRVGGEELPKGVSLAYSTLGELATGSGEVTMTAAIANLGERGFEYVAMPYTDVTSLYAWEQEYGFSDTGRWGWMRQLYGHIFSAKRAAYADLLTFGPTRNSPQVSVLAIELDTPTPSYEWCAAYTAKAARALLNDPARPLQTLALEGCKPAPLHEQFNLQELNTLAGSGLATQHVEAGPAMIMRETTTYQLNLYGQSDDAYELVTTLATLAKLIRNQRHAVTTKFPRHKLANDGTRFGPGQAIVTPGIIMGELVAQYRQDEYNGLVEDVQNFKKHLLVERDPTNPNRVNVLYPPDLVNQLRVFAVLAQFRLQYERGADIGISGPRLAGAGAA